MFKVFDKILKKEELTEEDYSKISPFVLNLWLSANQVGVQVAKILNMYDQIPLKQKVALIQSILPKQIKYIKYPTKDKEKDEYVGIIMKTYNLNKDIAKMYYSHLSANDLEELKELQNTGGFKR